MKRLAVGLVALMAAGCTTAPPSEPAVVMYKLDCGSFAPSYGEVDRQWKKWKAPLLYLVSQAGATR